MAKRKRLSPAALISPDAMSPETGLPADLETKSMAPAKDGWVGVRTRAPVASVTAEAAAQSAFEEVADELRRAKAEGRMVLSLPLAAIEAGFLVRDRIVVDDDDMASLRDSLRDRGQQTPIEVEDLGNGAYGLISGWRRLMTLRALLDETQDPRFAHVQALLRVPENAAASYRAMVEENEIRANLSFYERAHIAVKAMEQGLFPDAKSAVQSLFAAARRPKQSKIVGFTNLVTTLGAHLRWPSAIPEKLGLSLVAALQGDPRAVLDAALKAPAGTTSAPNAPQDIAPGITMHVAKGKVTFKGAAVDDALIKALRAWMEDRGA